MAPLFDCSLFVLAMRPVRTGLSAAWRRLTAGRGAIFHSLWYNQAIL